MVPNFVFLCLAFIDFNIRFYVIVVSHPELHIFKVNGHASLLNK